MSRPQNFKTMCTDFEPTPVQLSSQLENGWEAFSVLRRPENYGGYLTYFKRVAPKERS